MLFVLQADIYVQKNYKHTKYIYVALQMLWKKTF